MAFRPHSTLKHQLNHPKDPVPMAQCIHTVSRACLLDALPLPSTIIIFSDAALPNNINTKMLELVCYFIIGKAELAVEHLDTA